MARRMKGMGKRYLQEKTKFDIKQKLTGILLLTVLLIILIIESSLSFFSDVVMSTANALVGNVVIEMSNVQIEEPDVLGRPDEEATFANAVSQWTIRKCK